MPNRYICDVLEEMRKCNETKNYSYLGGLIEEAQTMTNRMEAALEDKHDLGSYHDRISDAKKELKDLRSKLKKIKEKDLDSSVI